MIQGELQGPHGKTLPGWPQKPHKALPPAEHTVAWQAAAVLQFGMKPAAIYQLLMIEGNGFGEEGFEDVD